MASRPVVREKRTPPNFVLWWGAGLGLFAVIMFASLQGMGSLALALFLASLVGGLILIQPALGVVVLTSTFFLSYPEVLQGSGWFTINNLLGLVLAGLLIVRTALEKRADVLQSKLVQCFLLIAFVVIVNHLLNDQAPPFDSLRALDLTDKRLHDTFAKLAFLIFFVAFIRTRSHILFLAVTIVGFVLITVPGAIWTALTGVGDIERIRASADFGIVAARNANRLAFVSAMAIALIGAALHEFRSRATVLLGALAISLLVLTIFLSASRSGLIGLLVLCVIFATTRIDLRRWAILLVVLAFSVGISLAVTPKAYVDRITNFVLTEAGEEGAGSTLARLGLLEVGLRMFQDHPFVGVGIGNFRWVSVVDYQNSRFSAMHNSYLLTLVEGGLLVFIPYLLLFWRTWKDLTRTRRRSAQAPELRLEWLVEATRAIFVLFLIFSFFADVWHEVFLYLIIGFAAVLVRLHEESAEAVRA